MSGTGTVWGMDASSGAPSYTGRMARDTASTLITMGASTRPLGGLSGVRPGTPSNIVTTTSTTYTVTPFSGVIDGESAAIAGPYQFAFPANVTGAVTAANATNPRVDIVFVKINDGAEGDGTVGAGSIVVDYLAGTAAPSPVAPAAPARSFVLANINVPVSGGGSPTVSWVAPYTAAAGGYAQFNTLVGLQAWTTAGPNQHATVINDATTLNNGDYTWNGTIWVPSRGAYQHSEFTSADAVVDSAVRYIQFANDATNTTDTAFVTAWANGNGNASGLTFATTGIYAVRVTGVLAANVSANSVFQAQTGSVLEGISTSGSGNQNFAISIPNYRVTAANQHLTILILKTNGSNAANTFRAYVDRIF